MDLTVLNVAIPDLERGLHSTTAQVQWIVDGYALALGGLVLSTGALVDRVGRRRAFITGLALCSTASLTGALAPTAAVVIAARCGMGVGAALLMPATLSIISNLFPQPEPRRRAIAAWAATAGLGMLTGPVIGGALVELCSWRAGFWINLPIGAVAIASALLLVPETRAPRANSGDPAGALLSAAALSALVWAVIEAPVLHWTSAPVLGAFCAAAFLLSAFLVQQHRSATPMLPLALVRDRHISGGAAALALMSFALFGALFVLTLYLQGVLGYTPWQAGLRTLPQAAALAAGSVAGLPLLSRYGVKTPVVLGLLTVSAAFGIMTGTSTTSTYTRLAIVQTIAGFGAGLVAAAGTEAIMSATPRHRAGIGSALNDATRQVGAALGVAVQGSLLATRYTRRLTSLTAPLHLPTDTLQSTSAHAVPGAFHPDTAIPPHLRTVLTDVTRHAFIDSMATTALVAGAVTLTTTVAVGCWMPGALLLKTRGDRNSGQAQP
ncbi:MFS transporter [Streptomyces olivoreticuli]